MSVNCDKTAYFEIRIVMNQDAENKESANDKSLMRF